MNFPSNFPELLPPSKEKEIPASLTDPQIRGSRAPDPQAILAMAKISTQTNYQSKIGNPLAISGPYGLGAINPMMSPNAGREVLTTQSPLSSDEINNFTSRAMKEGVIELAKRSGILARGTNPVALGVTAMSPLTLNADIDSERLGTYRNLGSPILTESGYVDPQKYIKFKEAEEKTRLETFEKQKRERNERWSNMKSDELNKKLQSADDHITHYFSRRAVK